LGKSGTGDGISGDAVLVKEIVEGQTELGLIDATACSEYVVEESVGYREGIDHGLVVILAIVLIESTDSFVEETKIIPALALIGHPFGLDVGRRVGYPQTRGCGNADWRTGAVLRSAVDVKFPT